MHAHTLWMHIEPSPRGRRLLSGDSAEQARHSIASLAEIVDRLDAFAAAEVDLVDSENDVEEAGLLGYELGIYLDQLGDEDRLDPGEMFGCVYLLLKLLDESGLYETELVLDDEDTTLEAMRQALPAMAEAAGYYVGPKTHLEDAQPAEASQAKFSKAELFFLEEAGITWPSSAMQLRRQWKILAARFHPDRNPAAAAQFRLVKTGFDALKKRAEPA